MSRWRRCIMNNWRWMDLIVLFSSVCYYLSYCVHLQMEITVCIFLLYLDYWHQSASFVRQWINDIPTFFKLIYTNPNKGLIKTHYSCLTLFNWHLYNEQSADVTEICYCFLSDITLLKFKLIKIYTLSYYCLHVHVPYVLSTQKT